MMSPHFQEKVLILGGSRLQVPAIEAAQKLGFAVLCADYDPAAEGFAVSDFSSLTSTLDVEAVERLALDSGVSHVITSTSDAPVRVAAYVSEKLGLPSGISYENAVCATQKDAMRLRLAEHGVPMPEFRICNTAREFGDALEWFGCDCIAKPADSAASRGVRLIAPSDLESDVDSLFGEFASFSRKGTVMVEERVCGPEVSVESMTVGGATTVLSITDKLTTEPPYFVELGHSEPSRLPSDVQEQIRRIALEVVRAIGIVDGPAHTEIMVSPEGPKVIEMAARLGGDFITSKLVPISTGVNIVEGSVAVALGRCYDFAPKIARGSAIRFIVADRPGVVESVEIPDGIAELKGVEDVEVYLSPGDRIDTPHSSNDRIGHVVCSGETAEEAVGLAEKVASRVTAVIAEG